MPTAIIETTELISGECDEIRSHAHKVNKFVEDGEFHKALEELTSVIERATWISDLIHGTNRYLTSI